MMVSEQIATLEWDRDGRDWPLREFSQFVDAGGLRWHVQLMGEGPVTLLIHGAGASLHSWHGLMPLLATRGRVLSVDLPGHGFTRGRQPGGSSLHGMARGVKALLSRLEIEPAVIIGHSAGAAIAAQMVLDRYCEPRGIISLNGVLVPFDRRYELLFSPLAKLLSFMPVVPQMFSWGARDRASVERLIESTGSRLDRRGIDLYWRLVRSPAHVAGALRMMASWDIAALAERLPRLAVPLTQMVALRDRTVPPAIARSVQRRLPNAAIVEIPGLGHLAHEERPDTIAAAIFALPECFHA